MLDDLFKKNEKQEEKGGGEGGGITILFNVDAHN